MADDRLKVTHLMGKKLDEPIIIEWGTKTENKNKMAEVAKLFNKRLCQNFEIEHSKLCFRFTTAGLMVWEKEAGCYLPAPHDVFMELLQGKREVKHGEGDCQ